MLNKPVPQKLAFDLYLILFNCLTCFPWPFYIPTHAGYNAKGVGLLSSIFAANDSGMHAPDDPWPKSSKSLFSNCIRLRSFHFCFHMSYAWGILGHDSHDHDIMYGSPSSYPQFTWSWQRIMKICVPAKARGQRSYSNFWFLQCILFHHAPASVSPGVSMTSLVKVSWRILQRIESSFLTS